MYLLCFLYLDFTVSDASLLYMTYIIYDLYYMSLISLLTLLVAVLFPVGSKGPVGMKVRLEWENTTEGPYSVRFDAYGVRC